MNCFCMYHLCIFLYVSDENLLYSISIDFSKLALYRLRWGYLMQIQVWNLNRYCFIYHKLLVWEIIIGWKYWLTLLTFFPGEHCEAPKRIASIISRCRAAHSFAVADTQNYTEGWNTTAELRVLTNATESPENFYYLETENPWSYTFASVTDGNV